MSEQQKEFTYDGFAIFEAMGHIKRVGKIRTSDFGGNAVFIVESNDPEGNIVTEIFAAASLFRLTPVTEAVVAAIEKSVNPSPINAYDLPEKARKALLQIEREEAQKITAIDGGTGPRRRFRSIDPDEYVPEPDVDPDFDDVPL